MFFLPLSLKSMTYNLLSGLRATQEYLYPQQVMNGIDHEDNGSDSSRNHSSNNNLGKNKTVYNSLNLT